MSVYNRLGPMATRSEQALSFAENLHRIALITDQTAVHRKKFEYALSYLRKIAKRLSSVGDELAPLDPQESDAAQELQVQLQALHDLIGQHLVQTWSIPTIMNPCNHVLEQLLSIFGKIQEAFQVLDTNKDDDIVLNQESWVPYHVLDLRAIAASFTQFLANADSDLKDSIEIRLESINKTLKEANADTLPDRVFTPVPVNYQNWRVNHTDFKKMKKIGHGVSADVFLGKDTRTNEDVAIKEFRFKKLDGFELQDFRREVAVLATATHPTLLKLRGATDSYPFSIVTDWMPHSSLYHDLHRAHRLDATGKTIAAFDIARGMQFLHSCNIIHRDLKSLNILLDAENRIRICDFGLSRRASDESVLMTQNIGTAHWMAPEILATTTGYTSKVDVYAYGIVLWEIATDDVPYSHLDSSEIIGQVLGNDLRPPIPIDLNPGMRDLIKQCWDRNPNVRPSFDEIVQRIQSGEAVYNGTKLDQLVKYIKDHATSGEQLRKDVESIIKSLEEGEISLNDATNRLTTTTIPPGVIERAWAIVTTMYDRFGVDDMARYIRLFIKTSKMREATSILRTMPVGSVPLDVINTFVTELPTGCADADTNIVVAGCRNGAPDLCAVYATDPGDVALALEVTAQVGARVELKTAVCDRCVQSIGRMDTTLMASAMRCLLANGEVKRISFSALKSFITSTENELKQCAFLAIAAMSKDGKYPPSDLFEVLVDEFWSDETAGTAVVMGCKKEELAEMLVSKFETEDLPATELTLKALICAARFPALRPKIAALVEKAKFADENLAAPLGVLMEKLNEV